MIFLQFFRILLLLVLLFPLSLASSSFLLDVSLQNSWRNYFCPNLCTNFVVAQDEKRRRMVVGGCLLQVKPTRVTCVCGLLGFSCNIILSQILLVSDCSVFVSTSPLFCFMTPSDLRAVDPPVQLAPSLGTPSIRSPSLVSPAVTITSSVRSGCLV